VSQFQNDFVVSAGKAGQWGQSSSEILSEAIQRALWELQTTEPQDNGKALKRLKDALGKE
jgi:hypothetical protein